MSNNIFADTDVYINGLFAEEDEALKAVVPSLQSINSPMAEASISAGQGKFLQVLAHMCGAKKILELGTLGGYSTIWLARALPEGGKVVSIELDEGHARVAQENIARAGQEDKVDIRKGKCMDILDDMIKLGEGPFDLVFMDADKPPYTEYFQRIMKLSRAGTIIVADNVIRNGAVLDPGNTEPAVVGVRHFNEMLAAETRVTSCIIQTVGLKAHDGMAIAVVKQEQTLGQQSLENRPTGLGKKPNQG